jgi:predicted metalloenzyme YecM
MFASVDDFFVEARKYVTLFDVFVQEQSLIDKAQADHICFKCGSSASFEAIKALFEHESQYIYQSIISGRRISYIRFKRGIHSKLGDIDYLELSDQKQDGSQKEGFDHIEVFSTVGTYEEMVHELSQKLPVVHVARPHHTTDDIEINSDFIFRCTQGPLIEKIKATEMK